MRESNKGGHDDSQLDHRFTSQRKLQTSRFTTQRSLRHGSAYLTMEMSFDNNDGDSKLPIISDDDMGNSSAWYLGDEGDSDYDSNDFEIPRGWRLLLQGGGIICTPALLGHDMFLRDILLLRMVETFHVSGVRQT